MDDAPVLHATTVALDDRAVLIFGPSGTGKSGLALQLMAMGCALVADDRTRLRRDGARLIADSPPTLRGKIEARFVGILAAPPAGPVPLVLAIDMGKTETERLPPPRGTEVFGVTLPLLHKVESSHFPAAILQYLKAGPAPDMIENDL